MNSTDLRGIKTHSGLFLGLGIALIALGSLAIYSVTFTTFASVIFFGWLLVFAGIIQLGHAFYARRWNGFILQLIMGILSVAAGVLLLVNPGIGAMTLTLLLSFMFIVQGAIRIVLALMKHFEHWGWVLLSGLLTFALGIMILYQWPYSGLYVIGLFVGIDLIFSGWALVALSLISKKQK